MKIGLNLAVPESARERYALTWAIPAAVVGLAGLLFLGVSLIREFRAYRAVQKQVLVHRQHENQLRQREETLRKELGQAQYREVLRQAQYLNGLIDKKQISLTVLAAKVTKLMPGQARLAGFALSSDRDNLLVRFTITGRSEEAVETFLSNLEDSPDFQDVAIINQGFQEEGAGSEPVTISCTARYLPSAE
jgi:hypothetical protein